jgi:tight adherence protein C
MSAVLEILGLGGAFAEAGPALAALALLSGLSGITRLGSDSASSLIPAFSAQTPPRNRTAALRPALIRIGRTSVAARLGNRARVSRRLSQAGELTSVDVVLGLGLTAGLTASVLLVLGGTLSQSVVPSLLMSLPIGFAAARLPELALARRARRRQQRIGSRVADLAELLVATTGAGLNPPLALKRSADVLEGPLGDELRMAMRAVELGAPWRTVLDELAARTGDQSILRLVRAMGRSQRLGTPLASALHNVAEDLRTERRARAEELARRAPVKMLFPLVFLILPAFLLLTVGPVLLATLRTLH